jgi:hypothetical protein
MLLRDWLGFLNQGAGKEIAIAQVPPAIQIHLGASSNHVFLHHAYAVKAVTKHRVWPGHFSYIFDAIERGIPVPDRHLHVTFLWDSQIDGWFQVTVKRAFETKRIYICTFYKIASKKAAKKIAKYGVISGK